MPLITRHSTASRPWLRGGNAGLNFCLSFFFVALLLVGAKAQDIGTDLNDGSNTSVTIKHRLRPVRVQYDKGGNITWYYVKYKLNNADDSEISNDGKFVDTTRTVAQFKLQSVTIDGTTLTGAQILDFLAKAGKQNWEADHP